MKESTNAVKKRSDVRIKESGAEEFVGEKTIQEKKKQSAVMQSTIVPDKTREKQAVRSAKISYQYAGYQVHISFAGERTLKQCIQNLAERKIEDPELTGPEKAEQIKDGRFAE